MSILTSIAGFAARPALAAVAPYLIGAAVLAGGGYIAYQVHHQRDIGRKEVRAEWTAASAKQKADAAQLLAAETAKANKATGELNAARAALEDKDAQAAKTVAQLRADLRAKSRAAGGPGLRDPFAGSRLGSGGSQAATAPGAVSGAANPAAPNGLLSRELEDFLLGQAADADEVNRAYAACRADSLSVREMLK